MHRELRRHGVTLQLPWSEYRERCANGFGYTWFTEQYRTFAGKLDVVLRQDHRAGEKLFLDFAGSKLFPQLGREPSRANRPLPLGALPRRFWSSNAARLSVWEGSQCASMT